MRFLIVLCALFAASASARANCLGGGALPPEEVAKFNAAPGAYFSGLNNSSLQEAVRKLAASDQSTIPGIMTAFKSMPLAMQTVITQGLGLAAKACQTTNEAQGRAIQLAAADFSPSLRAVFDTFAGQRDVGSTGGAGGGGAGGASGGGVNLTSGNPSNSGYSGPTSFSRLNGPTAQGAGGSSGAAGTTGGFSTSSFTTTQTFITNPPTSSVPQRTSP